MTNENELSVDLPIFDSHQQAVFVPTWTNDYSNPLCEDLASNVHCVT